MLPSCMVNVSIARLIARIFRRFQPSSAGRASFHIWTVAVRVPPNQTRPATEATTVTLHRHDECEQAIIPASMHMTTLVTALRAIEVGS